MLSVLASKALVLGILFLMTFCLGLIPMKLVNLIQHAELLSEDRGSDRNQGRKVATYKRILSFFSCFAAGVFLATCFLDLLPEVRKKLTVALFEMNIPTGFPIAEFIMCWGLFFILIIEQIVLLVKGKHVHTNQRPVPNENSPLLDKPATSRTHPASSGSMVGVWGSERDYSSEHSIVGITNQPEQETPSRSSLQENRLKNTVNDNQIHSDHDHSSHSHDMHFQKYYSPVRAFILLIAISVHSVFEGLAVGLQSNTGQVLGIFGALVLHKSILCFSIGMNLVQSKLSTKAYTSYIFSFSITTPIGVVIGILITDLLQSTASNITDGVLQGIACGTFLFITFFEVMPSEFNSSHDRMLKLLMLLVGYGVVTGILFFSDDVKAPFCKTINGN